MDYAKIRNNEKKKYKPTLAVTMGDPAGIGPEIAAKAFSNKWVSETCNPVLIGHAPILEKALEITKKKLVVHPIKDVSKANFMHGVMNVYEVGAQKIDTIKYGEISAEAGDIAFRSIKKAIELGLDRKVDGTVTGPVNKESINRAGYQFSGHTEVYAHFTGTQKFAMLLAHENFRVIHVTTHVSLREACDLIRKERIYDVVQLLDKGLRDLGIEVPRIGIAGLNPHSGDGGLFGNEEIEHIAPAVEKALKHGINIEGPIPPDTLFALAKGGKYDGCVAMYHDQGHIPFKLLGFDWDSEKNSMKSVKGVNITLGLPIVRTSVDHGTAFEIAGKGIASEDALLHAIEYAMKLVK